MVAIATAISERTFLKLRNLIGRDEGDEIALLISVPNARAAGARGDGVSDDTVALQKFIDAQRGSSVTYIPPGRYRITDSLFLTAGDEGQSQFRTIWVMGDGSYTQETGAGSVQIVADFKDRPAFVVQGGRTVRISGIEIRGKNTGVLDLTVGHTAPTAALTDDEADYISEDCTNGRYNPYCAVAIDPFSGAQPGSEYYPGGYYSATKAGTTKVTIEDCSFREFVVGVCIKPSDDDNNGDHVRIIRTQFRDCTYGISNGNSQARCCVAEDCMWFAGYVCCESSRHGKQIGAPIFVRGGSVQGYYHFMRCQSAYGNVEISGLYAETLKSLGYFGRANSSSQLSAHISGCHFKLRKYPFSNDVDSTDPAIHLRTYMPTVFSGCTFSTQMGVLNVVTGTNEVLFDACEFNSYAAWNDIYYLGLVDVSGTTRVTTRVSQYATSKYLLASTSRWNCPDTEQQFGTYPARLDMSLHTRRAQGPSNNLVIESFGGATGLTRVSASGSSYSWAGDTLTFTAADGTDFLVDDILYWQTATDPYGAAVARVPALKVTNVSTNTITAKAIVGWDALDQSYQPASVGIAYRPYAHTVTVTGTTTSGSKSVTNVADAENLFKVGDFITGHGIAAKSRVTAVSGTTVTISKNATATANYIHLYCCLAWRDDVPRKSADAFWARNGSLDDTKAIMACLDHWAECELLSVAKGGIYTIDAGVDMPSSTMLRGAEMQATIVRAKSGVTNALIRPGLRCTVRDFQIDGLDTASSVGVQPTSTDVLLDRLAITNFATGVVIDSTAADAKILNSRITSCTGDGIVVGATAPSGKVTIACCVIDSNGASGVAVTGAAQNLTVRDNEITNNVRGVYFTASSLAPVVEGNRFANNSTADCDVGSSSITRSLRFVSNYCVTSPNSFRAAHGVSAIIEGNTFNPGGTPKSIQITSANCLRFEVGQNVYLSGAYSHLGGDNSGTRTRYLGQIFAASTPNGSGPWETGEVVYNSAPASGQPMGWMCSAGHASSATFIALANAA